MVISNIKIILWYQFPAIYILENVFFSTMNWHNNLKLLHPCDSMTCWIMCGVKLADTIKWHFGKRKRRKRKTLTLFSCWESTGGIKRQETHWLSPRWIVERVSNNNPSNLVSYSITLNTNSNLGAQPPSEDQFWEKILFPKLLRMMPEALKNRLYLGP